MTVDEMKANLLSVDLRRVAYLSLIQNKKEVIDTQRDQMFSGKRVDGSNITPPYRSRTIKIKRFKGQPTDRVTLKDTGDFYEGFTLSANTQEYNIWSTDYKNAWLIAKYKQSIFGLNIESATKVKPTLQNSFVRIFKIQAGIQ